MEDLKVEITHYRKIDKGAFQGLFTIVIGPYGQKIFDCRYFVMGDKRWFSFPQKEVSYTDGRKTDYLPYVSYQDKTYFEKLKEVILNALQNPNLEQLNGQKNDKTYSRTTNNVPRASSADTGDLPF